VRIENFNGKTDAMVQHIDIAETKWELAELRGSLNQLTRELSDLQKEIEKSLEEKPAPAEEAKKAMRPIPLATRVADAPVARVVFKANTAKAVRIKPEAKAKVFVNDPSMHRCQPIRLSLTAN
jgi:regulator of replication initiation timing